MSLCERVDYNPISVLELLVGDDQDLLELIRQRRQCNRGGLGALGVHVAVVLIANDDRKDSAEHHSTQPDATSQICTAPPCTRPSSSNLTVYTDIHLPLHFAPST